jgi:hypothetical protein
VRRVLAALGVAAALLVPSPAVAAPERPPTDAVHVTGLESTCPPDGPCMPGEVHVTVDKTYPGRLVAWAKELVP